MLDTVLNRWFLLLWNLHQHEEDRKQMDDIDIISDNDLDAKKKTNGMM